MKETRLGHCKVRTRDVKKTKDSFSIQCNPLYITLSVQKTALFLQQFY